MDVATLCLAVLAHGPASGYEIKKELEGGAYAHFFRASFGSIYPALARLAAEGFISGREQEQAKRPDKKVYRLTPTGKRELSRRLQAPIGPDYIRSEFLLVLFHADLLPPRHRRALIDQRIQQLKSCIAEMTKGGDAACNRYEGAGPAFVHGYGLAVYTAELDYLESQRRSFDLPGANAA
ncbi:MAG TPA: PadR family transcriptional regulator [Methylomirabilota bacterium]|jgi:DNA-binding PadR family transcriptional regulator|nr:PadR family transcriptional regulator [Methylomirabilota bacterium]